MSIGTVVLFPLTLASNVFVAPQTMPGWLQAFVRINPVSRLVTAERGVQAPTRSRCREADCGRIWSSRT